MKQTMVALCQKPEPVSRRYGGLNQEIPERDSKNPRTWTRKNFFGIFFGYIIARLDGRAGVGCLEYRVLVSSATPTKVSISYQNDRLIDLAYPGSKTCIKAVLVKSTTMGPV